MTILCIDDDIDDQQVFKEAVEAIDPYIQILCAFSGPEALSILEVNRPDLIFLDDMMPKMNGHEFLLELNFKKPIKRLTVYSSNLTPEKMKVYKDLGVNNFLPKPNTFDELKLSLINILKEVLRN